MTGLYISLKIHILGHDLDFWAITQPTPFTGRLYSQVGCKVGGLYISQKIHILGHNLDFWAVTQPTAHHRQPQPPPSYVHNRIVNAIDPEDFAGTCDSP